MTPLRQRLIEKLRLKNYSVRTQQAYVAAVAHFARHFGRSPDQLGAAEIHQWQLHLKDVRKCSWSGYNVAMFRDRGVGYAIASDLDNDQMFKLVSGAVAP